MTEHEKIVQLLLASGETDIEQAKIKSTIFIEVYSIKQKAYYKENKERIKLREIRRGGCLASLFLLVNLLVYFYFTL